MRSAALQFRDDVVAKLIEPARQILFIEARRRHDYPRDADVLERLDRVEARPPPARKLDRVGLALVFRRLLAHQAEQLLELGNFAERREKAVTQASRATRRGGRM